MLRSNWIATLVLTSCFVLGGFARAEISRDCENDKECIIEVPGTQCADGTPSFITLTKRAGAKNVLIYMHGGGACWNKETCEEGYAWPLTRMESPTDWNTGEGIHDAHDPANPFAAGYNIITIPYCTGDVYAGNKDTDYGANGSPYVIRHRGYENVVKDLAKVKELFPSPEKAVLSGCSAGGVGAYFHLRNLVQTYPEASKFVVSDAGTPFKPPYMIQEKYEAIMQNWGSVTTLPLDEAGQGIRDFGALIAYNTRTYPQVAFGLIDGYQDHVMSFFAWKVGTLSLETAVRNTLIDAADNAIGRNTPHAKVYYTDSDRHCHTPDALAQTVSQGTSLSRWLTEMVGSKTGWQNVRPDLR